MQATENHPIMKTSWRFALFGALTNAIIFTTLSWGESFTRNDPEDFLMTWMIYPILFFFAFLAGLGFSWINGLIIALLKFRLNHAIKYFAIFTLGFLLTLPISYILIVGFGANKTINQTLIIILTFGLTGGLGNLMAGIITLPKP